jgi:DNA-binding NarL/FixJ family response regulator
VKTLLEVHPGWKVCGQASTGLEAVAKCEELKPDVVVLDISMPDLNGIEAARKIRKSCPNTEILILSMHYTNQLIYEIIKIGVRGYVVKSDSERDLVSAMESLSQHKPFFTNCVTEVLLSKFNSGSAITDTPESIGERLTPRESEVLKLLAEGKSSKRVAAQFGISVTTSETHRANIMRKLQIQTVSDLVKYAVRNKIIDA